MELVVVSPFETHTHDIAWIELTTLMGNFIVQHGHAPMVVSLKEQSFIVFRLESGKRETITIRQGIAEITRTKVTVLINEQRMSS